MDDEDLRGLLEDLHAMSYGWALHCCASDPQEAEDVLQGTYEKILRGSARYGGGSSFKTWLFAVIRNTAREQRRRRWTRILGLERFAREPREATLSPRAGEEEETRALREALQKLPARQHEVLHLVFYQDLTIEAAAGVMGVSLGSARTHYERGKRRLAELLPPREL